ncbi:hypothetical protein Btru_046449 [Bulinus truncatus]|nr:hypothetical protein Btru_046449 [Bulinus truncatus]
MNEPERNLRNILTHLNLSQEVMEYYVSLRIALADKRSNCDIPCSCDPRDLRMLAKLNEIHWKPMVTLKLPMSQDEDSVGFASKQTALDNESIKGMNDGGNTDGKELSHNMETSAQPIETFVCGVHGCSQVFSSIANYESHYYTSHNFRCVDCKRIFVSNFLLDIHIQENHDSYFKALCSRIPMYRCLVENCTVKLRTETERQNHLVHHHKYPAKFSFHRPVKPKLPFHDTKSLIDTGHDKLMSCPNESSMQTDDIIKAETDSKHTQVGTDNRVPNKICFGRGSKRAFKKQSSKYHDNHWYQKGKMDVDTTVDIENINFQDLKNVSNMSIVLQSLFKSFLWDFLCMWNYWLKM